MLKVVEEELAKLGMMETTSSEFHVTRSYEPPFAPVDAYTWVPQVLFL